MSAELPRTIAANPHRVYLAVMAKDGPVICEIPDLGYRGVAQAGEVLEPPIHFGLGYYCGEVLLKGDGLAVITEVSE